MSESAVEEGINVFMRISPILHGLAIFGWALILHCFVNNSLSLDEKFSVFAFFISICFLVVCFEYVRTRGYEHECEYAKN